ncbi:MAG: LysR family transcriptional regulator [Myxococcales bacterium]|nr:LysR family transcriptional regulator [Myxococcales bacterium]
MDWRSVTFDWNRARAFLVTAEEGSFSAAARALGMSQPTIGRQVAGLEEELGVALFARVGHGVALTDTGRALLAHMRAMGDAASQIALVAAGQSEALEGTVSVAASEVVASHLLAEPLVALRRAHPGLKFEIVASTQASDLRRREADIAVRHFRPTDPELVARKLTDAGAGLYASTAWLAEHGEPTSPQDLATAAFLGFDWGDAMAKGLTALGVPVRCEQFVAVSENQLVQWALAKAGAGVAVMMEAVGDRDPRMVRLLPDLPPLPVPVWLTAHREVRSSARVRVVFDHLAQALAAR